MLGLMLVKIGWLLSAMPALILLITSFQSISASDQQTFVSRFLPEAGPLTQKNLSQATGWVMGETNL